MQQPSKLILIGGIVIISVGVVNAAINKKPETPVLVGGIGFVLLASLLDAIGGGWSKIATGFVGLAVVTVVLVEGPSLFTALTTARTVQPDVSGGATTSTSTSTTGTTSTGTSTGGGSSLHL